MDPRRLEQLDRARKLGANVSVLLGQGDEAPSVVELGRVGRDALASSKRVWVQVQSWTELTSYATICALDGDVAGLSEAALADAVDRALDRFEAPASA